MAYWLGPKVNTMVAIVIMWWLNWWTIYAWINIRVDRAIDWVHIYSTTVKAKRGRRTSRVRGRPRIRGKLLTCHAVMVFAATAKSLSIVTFDTDSGEVGIDNCVLEYILHVIGDFLGPMRECNKVVRDLEGAEPPTLK